MKGKIQIETVSSQLLKGNPLGDSHRREVPVYLPPTFGTKKGHRYPAIYYLTGFTGTGRSAVNYNPWKANVAKRLDRLIAQGKAKESVLVFPDCFTAYGGSQYVKSAATGPYEDHVIKELVPYIEDKFGVMNKARGRALMGKSSGGCSLMLAMKYPNIFSHLACHSGDMFFEMCYGMEIPKFVMMLGKYKGSALEFTRKFLAAQDKSSFEHYGH